MPQIISTNKHARVVDKKLVSSGKIADEGIGYYEDQHIRNTQEDALFWTTLTKEQLTSENRLLTPEEIAHRLWTSYKVLDKTLDTRTEAGTTASTTVYDGKGHLITATLADAAAFAVVYDLQGMALGVVRLNSVTHKPSDPAEEERIYSTGGYVDSSSGIPRVVGDLAVSRAIGDREYRKFGVCAEPTIDITSTDEIASKLRIPKENIGKIQVISTCDGFTDGARDQSKKGQEDYLLSVLKKIEHPGVLNEAVLAKRLVDAAKKDGSQDNISVAIQSITKDTSAFLLGVYDGHGGDTASIHVAENIGGVFANLCALSRADYAEHEFSINKNRDLYNRDNLTPLSKIVKKLIYLTEEYQRDLDSSNPLKGTINPILTRLLETLKDDTTLDLEKINSFFRVLDTDSGSGKGKNINVITQDETNSGMNYFKGVCACALALVTVFIAPLIIKYFVEGWSPLNYFKPQSHQYKDALSLIKKQASIENPDIPDAPENREELDLGPRGM